MSAPGNAPNASTGLVIEPAGQLLTLWVTTFVVANIFAGFWLVKAFINALPSIAYRLNKVSSAIKLHMPGAGSSSHGTSRCSSSSSLPVQSQDSLGRFSEDVKKQQQQMQPVVFEWHNMGCTVDTASGSRAILQVGGEIQQQAVQPPPNAVPGYHHSMLLGCIACFNML
jgi:hypothetical protein